MCIHGAVATSDSVGGVEGGEGEGIEAPANNTIQGLS